MHEPVTTDRRGNRRSRRRPRPAAALAAVALTAALSLHAAHAQAGANGAADASPGTSPEAAHAISPAETALFMSAHLKDLDAPRRLHYEFRKSGTLEKGFSDSVDIDITAGADGSKNGTGRFFSGSRRIPYPPVEHAEGNPVLLYFLEREIREMARLTSGQPNYFRKRIRMALAEAAVIEPATVRFNGRSFPARRITITPYQGDPNRSRFEKLAAKRYVFTISDQIPGVIYQIRGEVPAAGASKQSAPVLDEVLTLRSSGPVQ